MEENARTNAFEAKKNDDIIHIFDEKNV